MFWRRPHPWPVPVGLVGCGAIGTTLARHLDTRLADRFRVVAITDVVATKAAHLATLLTSRPAVLALTPLIQRARLVIEAAAASVAFHIAQQALEVGRDVLVMSVGGLLGRCDTLQALAQAHRCRLLIPSGALCGLDGVKAMRSADIHRVTLTSRKPPAAYADAPFVCERHLKLTDLVEETTIFEGSAHEAVIGFPQNANVAATLALCTGRPDAVRVRLIAAPAAQANSHEVCVEGSWGRLTARLDSQPSATNPKTSEAAIASAQALLEGLFAAQQIGT